MKLPLTLALAALMFAPADTARAGDAAGVAEIVRFRLADGVSDAAFLDAARATRPFVEAAPGFVARRLSKSDDGIWTDYVEWADMASAQSAAEAIMAEPAAGPFMEAIDPASIDMRHETLVWQME